LAKAAAWGAPDVQREIIDFDFDSESQAAIAA
jgi:hypothetical protein